MLDRLTISNYALIDRLEVNFTNGFSIITGDTGAGKSVMMGALSLLMGNRADMKVLAHNEGRSVIEGVFSNVAPSLRTAFDDNQLDWNDGYVIVRREINPNGRSRAFINDSPVTLPLLEEISSSLVDVHSQHSNRLLSMSSYQRNIIDIFAEHGGELEEYHRKFREFAEIRRKLKSLREEAERNKENRELLAFQLSQLDKLNPRLGELKEIEREFDLLSDADEMRGKLQEAAGLTGEYDMSAMMNVSAAAELLSGVNMSLLEGEIREGESIAERLRSLYVELKDVSETLNGYLSQIEADPVRLMNITARMNRYHEACKRFKVSDGDELVALRDELRRRVSGADGSNEEFIELEKKGKLLGQDLKRLANSISERRIRSAQFFSSELVNRARPLGLKNLTFEARISQGKLTIDGADSVEFYCSFNKNQELMPLAKVASGGEMSRLTLCIKAMVAGNMKLPTVIFDEIDTGVSGEIADKMGDMMRSVAEEMQVIAITHLPQVAAKGDNHYLVYKRDLEDRTVSSVKELNREERVMEVARMLSGSEINAAALENARSLLGMSVDD
ncbi:MAG: DNA repair protein RecN [Bacteroidales bacterium]|nr:DNA repair protein RecN [Bacteroidales bacterium]